MNGHAAANPEQQQHSNLLPKMTKARKGNISLSGGENLIQNSQKKKTLMRHFTWMWALWPGPAAFTAGRERWSSTGTTAAAGAARRSAASVRGRAAAAGARAARSRRVRRVVRPRGIGVLERG